MKLQYLIAMIPFFAVFVAISLILIPIAYIIGVA